MPSLRAFAESAGIKRLASAKRDQAVTELIDRLVEMPDSQWKGALRQAVVGDRKLGDEYEQWVRLIPRHRAEDND